MKIIEPSDNLLSVNGGKNLSDLVKNWLSFIKMRLCPNTYKTYTVAINNFLDNLPPKSQPAEITPFHVEKYIQNLAQTNHAPKTIDTYLAAIKSFYGWAAQYCDIPNQVKAVPFLKKPPIKVRILTDQEYSAILQSAPTKCYHNAFQFLANTGLRINEFRTLQWENFTADFVHIIGKGHKSRFVPLNKVCKQIIDCDKSDIPPFVAPFKEHNPTYRLCARISKIANIEPFTPHAFRHYFATRLIRNGVPLIIVSKILGHANTQITEQIYVHLVPADLRVTDVLQF